MTPAYILCVLWGEQISPSTRVRCWQCGRALALNNGNLETVRTAPLQPICIHCAGREEVTIAGGLIGGKVLSFEAWLAAMEQYGRN